MNSDDADDDRIMAEEDNDDHDNDENEGSDEDDDDDSSSDDDGGDDSSSDDGDDDDDDDQWEEVSEEEEEGEDLIQMLMKSRGCDKATALHIIEEHDKFDKIWKIFRGRPGVNSDNNKKPSNEDLQWVLETLREYPELAKRVSAPNLPLTTEFMESNKKSSSYIEWHPLAHFVHANASLDVIQEVYEMYPGALRKNIYLADYGIMSILSMACILLKGKYDEGENLKILTFLAKSYPGALSKHAEKACGCDDYTEDWCCRKYNACGMNCSLPIHILMHQKAPLRALKTIIEVDPYCLSLFVAEDGTGWDCYCLAANKYGKGSPVTDLIAKTIQDRIEHYEFLHYQVGTKALILDSALPSFLANIEFEAYPNQVQDLLAFLTVASKSETIMKLSLDLQRITDSSYYNEEVQHALTRALQNMTWLKHLELSFVPLEGIDIDNDENDNDNDDDIVTRVPPADTLVDALIQGLASRKDDPLELLNIENIHVSQDSQLLKLLSSNIQTVHIQDIEAEASRYIHSSLNDFQWDDSMMPAPSSHVHEVRLELRSMTDSALLELVKFMTKLPCLQRVTIDREDLWCPGDEVKDFTEQILAMLAKDKLERLNLNKVDVDVPQILQGLRSNSSLKEFACSELSDEHEDSIIELLESHNTTIDRIRNTDPEVPIWTEEGVEKGILLTHWNHHGRGKTASATMEELVGSLAKVAADGKQWKALPFEMTSRILLSLQYSLLHQVPALWSSPALSKDVVISDTDNATPLVSSPVFATRVSPEDATITAVTPEESASSQSVTAPAPFNTAPIDSMRKRKFSAIANQDTP